MSPPVVARAVVLCGSGGVCDGLAGLLTGHGVAWSPSCDAAEAAGLAGTADLVIAYERAPGAIELLEALAAERPGVVTLLCAAESTLDLAVAAMRAGAADLLVPGTAQAGASIGLALERRRRQREREIGEQRLRSLCQKLDAARQEITSQVSGMCNDLVDAYRELSDQIDQLALGAEFNGVIRQELEIEGLLRVALEFVLAKLGPTNGAVFLPSTSSEFSLGAYINCDLERGRVDELLDHLADTLAPRFEHRHGVHLFADRRATASALGGDAHWLPEQAMLVVPCHHDGECLAVLTLFRRDSAPFSPEAESMLGTMSALFAAQLGRVIHVHHRHLPKHQWGALGDAADDDLDDLDLAA